MVRTSERSNTTTVMEEGEGGRKKRGRPPAPPAGGASSAVAVALTQLGAGAKKKRTVSNAYDVNDRVLYAILRQDADVIVGYALATVVKIVIDTEGCLYTIHLDRDGTNQEGVEESELCKSVSV